MPHRLIFAISRIHQRLTTHLKKELKGAGIHLSRGQIGILMVLERDGKTTMGRLSRELEIDNAAATRLVDKLEEQYLVVRQVNPEDRRQMLISVTAGGLIQAKAIKKIARAANQKIREGFSEAQMASYIEMNKAILQKFG